MTALEAVLPLRAGPMPGPCCDPEACRDLWGAAVEMYLRDARAGMRGNDSRYAREAFNDLTGDCVLLRNLCNPLGVDAALVARALLSVL